MFHNYCFHCCCRPEAKYQQPHGIQQQFVYFLWQLSRQQEDSSLPIHIYYMIRYETVIQSTFGQKKTNSFFSILLFASYCPKTSDSELVITQNRNKLNVNISSKKEEKNTHVIHVFVEFTNFQLDI